MNYTKEQISEIISKHAVQRNGLNDLLSIMLESMMMAERGAFLREDSTGNKGNGFRAGRTYGQGKRLEFRIPRDVTGNEKYSSIGNETAAKKVTSVQQNW